MPRLLVDMHLLNPLRAHIQPHHILPALLPRNEHVLLPANDDHQLLVVEGVGLVVLGVGDVLGGGALDEVEEGLGEVGGDLGVAGGDAAVGDELGVGGAADDDDGVAEAGFASHEDPGGMTTEADTADAPVDDLAIEGVREEVAGQEVDEHRNIMSRAQDDAVHIRRMRWVPLVPALISPKLNLAHTVVAMIKDDNNEIVLSVLHCLSEKNRLPRRTIDRSAVSEAPMQHEVDLDRLVGGKGGLVRVRVDLETRDQELLLDDVHELGVDLDDRVDLGSSAGGGHGGLLVSTWWGE